MFTLILALVTFICGLALGITFGPEIHNMVARATLDKAGDEDRKAAKRKFPTNTESSEPLIDAGEYWTAPLPPKPKRKNNASKKAARAISGWC